MPESDEQLRHFFNLTTTAQAKFGNQQHNGCIAGLQVQQLAAGG
jgi:hypothetical protein